MKMGQIGCPETSVKHHCSLRNDPEERCSRLRSGGSLKSRNKDINLYITNTFTVRFLLHVFFCFADCTSQYNLNI